MALKHWQLGLLHTAPAALGIDERERKLIQRNLAGAWSAKDMDVAGFARVMAFYERHGWRDARWSATFWRGLAERSDLLGLEGKVLKLASVLGWTRPDGKVDRPRLDGFVGRTTGGRKASLNKCDRGELNALIEALKGMVRGERGTRVQKESPPQSPPIAMGGLSPAHAGPVGGHSSKGIEHALPLPGL